MEKSKSSSYFLYNKFIVESSEEKNDNLVNIFFGWINDKISLSKSTPSFTTNFEKFSTFSSNFTPSPDELVNKASKYTKTLFLVLTHKKLNFFTENLVGFSFTINIFDVEDIYQDLNNKNYLEILFKENGKINKVEIVLENKQYFLEKFVEFYTFNKVQTINELAFFKMTFDKIDLKEKNLQEENLPGISELLDKNVENKYEVYENYIKINDNNENEKENQTSNNIELKKKISNQNFRRLDGKNTLDEYKKINEKIENIINTELKYKKIVFRFKKNLIILPENLNQLTRDTFILINPLDKNNPVKLRMGSLMASPAENLDTFSDFADVKENAHSLFSLIMRGLGYNCFIITKSEEFKNYSNSFFKKMKDHEKKEMWLIEAKTILKNFKSFYNVQMIFIRKSFFPPFFDSFKDYYFLIIEKKQISKNIYRNFEDFFNKKVKKILSKKKSNPENLNESNVNFENSVKSIQTNESSLETDSKIYKLQKHKLTKQSDNSVFSIKNESEKSGTKLNESGVLVKTKIVKKKKIVYVKKSDLKKLKEENQNEESIDVSNLKFKPMGSKLSKMSLQKKIEKKQEKNYLFYGGEAEKEKEEEFSNLKEIIQESEELNISKFSQQVIREIGESFSSMLLFDDEFYKKLIPLRLIKMETFSCSKSYYENSIQDIFMYKKLQKIEKFGIDILYKILLLLKGFAIDDVRKEIKICEDKMKSSKEEGFKEKENESISKRIKQLNNLSLQDILNEQEKNIAHFFMNYYGEEIDICDKKNKRSRLINDDNLTKTRSFFLDNRNDFLVFVLNGKFIKEIDLNLVKIIQISYKNKECQILIEKFFFRLLNLKANHEKNKMSERDIINDICSISTDTYNLKITYDEDVMAAMIETNFFMMNGIIDSKINLEKFYYFIFENNSSNKILKSFLNFLIDNKKGEKNFDKIVNSNFDKGNKINQTTKNSPNNKKKSTITNPNLENRMSKVSGIFGVKQENFEKDEIIENNNHSILEFGINIDDMFNNDEFGNRDVFENKNDSTHFKEFNYKIFSDVLNAKICLTKSNKVVIEKNNSKNLFKVDNEKLINYFYKIFSYKDLNLTKTLISSQILLLACRDVYENRIILIKKNFFQLIESHIKNFSDEKLVINGLKLFNVFLDPNDYSVVEYLKKYDVWDDYVILLINTIIDWGYQGIKCSSEIICEVLNLLYRISFFSMIEMNVLFTEGYINKEFFNSKKDFLFDELNSAKTDIMNGKEKTRKNFKEFLIYIVDDEFLQNMIHDKENAIIIYEKLILLLVRSNYVDSKIKNLPWIKEMNLVIEEKLIFVYCKMEKQIMEFLELKFKQQNLYLDESQKETGLVYKIYTISMMYFKEIYDRNELFLKMEQENSPLGMVVRFFHACRNIKKMQPFWEKAKYFYNIIEEKEDPRFLKMEECINKKEALLTSQSNE